MSDELRPTEPDPRTASSEEILAWVQYCADKLTEKRNADNDEWLRTRRAELEAANKVAVKWRAIARLANAREKQEAVGRTT